MREVWRVVIRGMMKGGMTGVGEKREKGGGCSIKGVGKM